MNQVEASDMARRIRTALQQPDTVEGAAARAELLQLASEISSAVVAAGGAPVPARDDPRVN